MNTLQKLMLATLLLGISLSVQAQDTGIQTIFKNRSGVPNGGYGAITNKFTTINGEFANIVQLYGGWYINKKLLLGAGGGAMTNNMWVPAEHRAVADKKLSYEYGQVGLMTEYVLWSDKAVHMSFSMLIGAGFTLQYDRYNWEDDDHNSHADNIYDTDWFLVAEPGIQVEFNLIRSIRFCPGISYRFTQGSEGRGLDDSDLRGASINLTMKFGKF